MVEFLLLRQSLVLLSLLISSYTDIRKGLIFDRLTIPMIAVGLALNLLEQELFGIGIAVMVFLVGYAVYYAGKIGGGDVKLFTALSMLLPFYGNEVFVISILVVASISSVMVLSTFFLIKYFRKGISLQENKESILKAIFLGVLIAIYFFATVSLGYLRASVLLFLGIPTLFGLAFIALEKGIRKNFFLKKVKLQELEEDEIVATEFLEEDVRKELSLGLKGVLGGKEIIKLKKFGVKEVPVFRSLPPFAPFVLFAAIISLLFPRIVRIIMGF